ncbi:MAG: hypothetical protein HY819_19965 [Acidobacteria bacterium]|nr:hypothetical protein [Acidobacteriota bacterium]
MLRKPLFSICVFIVTCLVTSLFIEITANGQSKSDPQTNKTTPATKEIKEAKKESELKDSPKERGQYFFKQRAFPFNAFPVNWRAKALEHIEKNRPKIEAKMASGFTAIGPAPVNNGQTFGQRSRVTGRVTSLAIDPKQPRTVYLGAAQGGVWRTTDAGASWQPMTDNAPTQAVGALVLDPNDSNIIYVGTGEGNLSGDSFFGMGLLKSTDGGLTWANLARETFIGLSFSNLVIDRRSPNILYASIATGVGGGISRNPIAGIPGIYKSTDAGVSWANILRTGTPVPFRATDIEIDPSDSRILYATFFNSGSSGVFKTTDAGQTWAEVGGGLPRQDVSRVDIGIAPSNPNVVYASVGNSRTGDLQGIFKSTDKGTTWSVISNPPRSGFGNICQCFYDNIIVVDPQDENLVYYGGVSFYRSQNGGQSWTDLALLSNMHPDFHAIAINASSQGKQIYVGNDGGVWASLDGGRAWTNSNAGLNLTQFQSIAMHPTNPRITIGGTQDNGTNMYLGNEMWEHADDGDGGFTAIDQNNPSVMYHTFFRVSLRRSDSGGRLGTWVDASQGINRLDPVLFYAPFILDPNNQNTVYYGTSRLYRSNDQGRTWGVITETLTRGISGTAISAISVSPTRANSIYTGSSDGAVFASQDGSRFQNVTDNLPTRYISDVVVDPTSPTTIYASLGGFQTGHIFKSTTGGGNWQDISGNLPDVPAMALAINPSNSQNLFLGTDIGVFMTLDGGKNWQLLPGMPPVSVFDIAINTRLGLLRAATHGRGVYELDLSSLVDNTAPTIKVNLPNGAERLETNSQFTIKWVSNDNVGLSSHEIALSTDGGNTFPITVATGLSGQAQEFLWTVPATFTEQARIRITAKDIMGNSASDISDGDFIIASVNNSDITPPTIRVNSPNGLEELEAGKQFSIKWVSSDDTVVVGHEIVLSTDGGNSFPITVIAGLSGQAQEFLWTVPSLSTSQARIRIIARDLANNSSNDISDSNFIIMAPVARDFSLDFASAISVKRGNTTQVIARVLRLGGFDESVTIEPDANMLKTLKIKANPPSISTTGNQAEFSFKVKKKAPLGTQKLTFVAKDTQGKIRMAELMIKIE